MWAENGSNILHNISVDIKKGELVAVVGRIGSGKSSFLSAILGNFFKCLSLIYSFFSFSGEMYKNSGTLALKGKIAYVQQQPWIQNLTLEKNILFSRSMNYNLYNKILNACVLNIDLKNLPAGDQTEIGEKVFKFFFY